MVTPFLSYTVISGSLEGVLDPAGGIPGFGLHILDTDDVEEAPTNVPNALEVILLLLFPMFVFTSTIAKTTKDVA